MTGAICGGGKWGRGVQRCPVCKARRRGLVRLVFGGHGSDMVCGGCGTWWSDGEARCPGKREVERNRALVRVEWAKARAWWAVSREVAL